MNNNNVNRSLFTPGLPPVSMPSTASRAVGPSLINSRVATTNINPIGEQIMGRASQVKQGWDMLPNQVQDQIKTGVSNKVSEIFTSSGSGDKPNSSGYSLTRAPNPKAIQLDTGIKPNTYTSDYLDAEENKCSPLHVTHAKFTFPTAAANKLSDYFKRINAFDLQTKAQINITYNLDVSSAFSATNILTAMNSIVNAYQIYFYYASIISYHSDPVNKNAGMIYIRSQLTPTMIEDLTQLGRLLSDTPIPPKLLELLRYLSGNFLSGNTAEAPMIIINPMVPNETGVDGTAITAAIASLDVSATKVVLTLLRKAIPQWSPKVLFDVGPTPLFDYNFLTIFQNLPFHYFRLATFSPVPSVASSSVPFKYNTYTSELDGVAFALCSAWSTANSLWLPGLMSPTSTTGAITGNSRTSYYTVAGVTKFWPSDLNNYLSRSRAPSYVINDDFTAVITPHNIGTNMCEGVTPDTIRETSMNVIDYLMSSDTIKVDVKKYHFGSSSNSSGKSRRGK